MKRIRAGILVCIGVVFGLSGPSFPQQTLSPAEERIKARVEANFDAQILFLEQIVNINSGTRNLNGVRAVGDVFAREFDALGFGSRWIDMPQDMDRAGHFLAERAAPEGPRLLLIGHLDTVFPMDSPFQKFERDGDRATGPGATDMKDGDAIILYALKALSENGQLDRGTIRVFFTGDEESVGRPLAVARQDLIETAKDSDIALNFEGGSEGYAVIGRRGSSGWTLEVSGKRAHSSGIFRESVGAGAVFEISRILHRFYNEVRGEHGLTFNPGVIAGGTFVEEGVNAAEQKAFGKTNVVAQTAVVHGGLRFMNEAQKERARAAMRAIVAESLPQTEAKVSFTDSYPAMEETEANRALLAELNDVTVALGATPVKAFPPEQRGAADISFVAPQVTSMDALGGFGGGSHTPDEWVDLPSVKFATVRSAILIHRLLQRGAN